MSTAQHDSTCWAQVRVDAVAALRNLVEAFDDDHLDSIKPLLPELLNLLFALMVEVMAAPCCPCYFCVVPECTGALCHFSVGCQGGSCAPGVSNSCLYRRRSAPVQLISGRTAMLMRRLLRLHGAAAAQVESEDLVFTLETIVEKFGEEMAPYAVGVCQHLTQAFWRACVRPVLSWLALQSFTVSQLCKEAALPGSLHSLPCSLYGTSTLAPVTVAKPSMSWCRNVQEQESGGGDEDSDDGEGALAAYGCLRALYTVLER